MLTLSDGIATGVGDRVGTWMTLLAVGMLRNESVLVNWKMPNPKMPQNIIQDATSAGGCIGFPPPAVICGIAGKSARLMSPGVTSCLQAKATTRHLMTIPSYRRWWTGGKLQCSPTHPPRCLAVNYTLGLEAVPHCVYGAFTFHGLLNITRGHTLNRYLHTYRTLASRLWLRPQCRHSFGLELASQHAAGRLVLSVHLRRTDRGGSKDHRVKGAKAARQEFDNTTMQQLERLVHLLDESGTAVSWLLTSDEEPAAIRAQQTVLAARADGSRQNATVAPPNATEQVFFSMSESDGILQSIFTHGWSSYSSVASLLHGTPLFSFSRGPDRYRFIEAHRFRGESSGAAAEKLYYTRGEEASFLAAAMARHKHRRAWPAR